LDFITGHPEDDTMNTILVIIEKFSKMAHFIRTIKEISARETAKLLLHHVWKLHGTPSDIISDRSPQFISAVLKTLCQHLKIEQKLSTAYPCRRTARPNTLTPNSTQAIPTRYHQLHAEQLVSVLASG
jgi:hypothetical protein